MKVLTLVDFSHRLRVNFHARSPDSGPNDSGAATLQDLSDWRRAADHLIVAWDSPPYLRTQQYAEYKQGRARDEAYIQICKWTKERLIKDGYSIAFSAGHEADDCLATLALSLAPRFDETRIISEDKDLLACLTDKVKMYAPKQRGEFEVRDVEWLRNKWGISPEQVALFLAITGDKSDAIPGIPGIGEKGASKLIQEFGTIEKMRMAAVDAFTASKQEGAKPLSAFWDRFLKGSPRLPEWLALTTLRTDLPLDVDALLVKRAPLPLVVESAEDIEHGDAWEPSADELREERDMLDPEVVISGPPKAEGPSQAALTFGAAAIAGAATRTADAPSGVAQAEATSKKAAAGPAESTPPARAPSTPPSAGTAPAVRPPRTSDDPASIVQVVDRPHPPNWALQIQPASMREAKGAAIELWNSRHYMQLEHMPGVLSIILKGRELGLGMMAALEMFYLVKGRPYPSAKGKQYLASRDPDCEWIMITESDEKHATIKTKHRKAGLLEYTYTIERAQRAGYLTGGNKHNWATITQEMLEARAKSKGSDLWYPGSTFGMPSVEDIQDREGSDDE